MKANSVGLMVGVNNPPQAINFRNENVTRVSQDGHDEFVRSEKSSSNKKLGWIVGGIIAAVAGALLAHQSGWFKKAADKVITYGEVKFKSLDEAKTYFENLGIKTDFRGATAEHLDMLGRIKENLKKLEEMKVKIQKPDSITISDWKNAQEYEELCRQKGFIIERKEGYHAFCAGKPGESHVFINSNVPSFNKFMHEMGHANHHEGYDSFWQAKGLKGYEYANKQLELLGSEDKIYIGRDVCGRNLSNIVSQHVPESPSRFVFPTTALETRYVYTKDIVDKMYAETRCYDGGVHLGEEVADIFEGLLKGKTYSDEVMLYYDFAGGARIPNLKIEGKTYDEYIESLYNNKDLVAKLRENIKISKI